ncbi:NfeD family protein [Marinactinospora thermotolerans]|uniref:Membrane protein implicated in regulation of membrane protease activity n=1 Tax=Marinactinospora thermotolerans DSM 45154 TaxID=1122192 RepID=A0A1T4T8H8_9ACTN|nr:NfeD family protein [Marinactinospora thermotolerans]SKA36639.1 Membrane protein implicated in regulation of membrane protease activity [Marinactinospora thermotolerans DSM 45154]
MALWVGWLLVALVLGVAEIFTLTLSLGLIAAAALVAGVVGALGAGVIVQVLAFAVAAAAGLLVVRPIARRHLSQPPPLRSGTAALVGRTAVVVEEVTAEQGRIRLSGEEWSARALDETQSIPAGSRVDVMEIEGATAIVYPHDQLP